MDGIRKGEREGDPGRRRDETSPKSGRRGAGVEAGGGCARTWYSARNAATFFSRSARIWRRSCSKRMSFLSNWVAIRSWRLRRGRSRGGGSRSSDVSRRFLMRPPRTFRGWRVRANGAARGAPVVLRLLPRAGGLLRDLRLERGDVDLRRTGKGGWSGQSGRPEGARRGRESSQMWFPRWRNGTERRARTPVVRLLAL